MKYLRIALVFIWRIWFCIVVLLASIIIGIPIYISTFQKNDRITYSLIRWWAGSLFYGAGFTYTFSCKEKLDPSKSYLLVSNHTSLMDICLMFILHPKNQTTFVGKKELKKYPLFGEIYKKMAVMVDRTDKSSRGSVYPAVKRKLILENKSVVIFPEGGVPSREVILGKFHEGVFAFSQYCEVPIVVYAFHNLKNMFPFVNSLGYPGRVKVERVAILYPDGETKESLKEKTFDMIYDRIKDDKIEYPEIK